MILKTSGRPLGPGEQRNRQRRRNHFIYLGIALLVGLLLGATTGFFDKGEGDLFAKGLDGLSLPAPLAILVALGFLVGLLGLPLYGFRMLDDYKRERNLIAFTGGCLAVLSGYPAWAALHAGGLVPAPHAFGIFAIAYGAMIVAFLYARWRL